MVLTQLQKESISVMRESGVPYVRIAEHLELNVNTVKAWCHRNGVTPSVSIPVTDPLGVWCLQCSEQIMSKRSSKFCS